MQPKIWKWQNSPLEIAVVFSVDAVDAYNGGETSIGALSRIGQVKLYEFNSFAEMNAFIHGVEEAQGALEALPVDDLTS